jgi:hypothetical protein
MKIEGIEEDTAKGLNREEQKNLIKKESRRYYTKD